MKKAENSNRPMVRSEFKPPFDFELIQQPNVKNDWMDSAEAAEFLRISKRHLMNMTSSSQLPYYKLFNSNRCARAELNRFLRKNKSEPAHDTL